MRRGLGGRGGVPDRLRERLSSARPALALVGAALLIAAALAGSARPLLAQEPGGTVEMDRAALLTLYEATDGPNWADSGNWGSDAPLADWYGVRTDGHGRVTGLTLERNNLSGTLPAELGRLDALTVLALGGNGLRGPIPAELGALANLTILILGANGLTGPIPAALGDLTGLRVARFAGNAVSGCVPHGLRDLLAAPEYAPGVPAHDFLPFDGNGDGDLDDALDLPGLDLPFCLLRELRLSGAALDPPFAPGRAVYNASVIRSVAEAVVTATTYGAGDVVTIRKGAAVYAGGEALPLDLGPNRITIEVVPPDSTPKQTLSVTLTRRLNDDALTVRPGALSPAFSDTVDFYTVHVAHPVARITIEGTTAGGGRVAYRDESGTAITDADASAAGLQLDLPAAGGRRVHVVMHDADGPPAATRSYTVLLIREGTVATDRAALLALYGGTGGAHWRSNANWASDAPLGDWSGVTTDASGRVSSLALEGSILNGPLPAALGHLDHLAELSLGGNGLQGPLPAALGNLARLRKLNLSHNRLEGPIPDLSGLPQLTYLSLRGNHFSGPLPAGLGRLARLTNLFLDHNRLSGPLPPWLGRFADLKHLFLDHNQFSGPLPDLSALGKLAYLHLGHNQLQGPLPVGLGALTGLRELHLPNNQFSGPLPDLSTLGQLTYLHLGHNQLSGPFPAGLGRHPDLRELTLAGNRLVGPLPATLGDLPYLRATRFAGNAVSGCVPYGLRRLLAAPASDFLPFDANGDGDTADAGDRPGLGLPFCLLRDLSLEGATLDPPFAGGRTGYTASVPADVAETAVTAALHDAGDRVTIHTGEETYAAGEAMPLDPGLNPVTIEIAPADGTPPQIVALTVLRGSAAAAGIALTLRAGGGFYAVPAGAPTTAARLFKDTAVAIVWKYNRATRAWDLAYVPAQDREDFAIAGGDVLWVVAPRAQTVGG